MSRQPGAQPQDQQPAPHEQPTPGHVMPIAKWEQLQKQQQK